MYLLRRDVRPSYFLSLSFSLCLSTVLSTTLGMSLTNVLLHAICQQDFIVIYFADVGKPAQKFQSVHHSPARIVKKAITRATLCRVPLCSPYSFLLIRPKIRGRVIRNVRIRFPRSTRDTRMHERWLIYKERLPLWLPWRGIYFYIRVFFLSFCKKRWKREKKSNKTLNYKVAAVRQLSSFLLFFCLFFRTIALREKGDEIFPL